MLKINERIKKLRFDNKLTQKQMAEILDIREVSYQRFEYGTSRPSLDTLLLIAEHFKCSLDWLIGRTDNPNINE
jgi:transcriptional regulator with XRE-family HTH domain